MGVGVGGGAIATGIFVGSGVGYIRIALIGAGTSGRALTTRLGRGRGCPVFSIADEVAVCMAVAGCGVTQGFV